MTCRFAILRVPAINQAFAVAIPENAELGVAFDLHERSYAIPFGVADKQNALRVLHGLGRRLMMKLRRDRLRSGRAARRAGWRLPDPSLELRQFYRARSAMGSAAAADHGGASRGDEEADTRGPPDGFPR